MNILGEARASIALDKGDRVTCSKREGALEWPLRDYEIWIYRRNDDIACVARAAPLVIRGYGTTPALAIVACAREAGWPG
jgi:hypothetical protein